MAYVHEYNWSRHLIFEEHRIGSKKFTNKESYNKYLLIKRERDALIDFYLRLFERLRCIEEQLFFKEGYFVEQIMKHVMETKHDERLSDMVQKAWKQYIKDANAQKEKDKYSKKLSKQKVENRFQILDLDNG